ncbi:D-glucuronyl C5-epimerase [Lepeophtheirus salmonis]|uniref:D-glucuronyl C5-epimerase n=1 Tax=Lepeophtheirus salmonis TaxID=72036 RepID=UPI001AE3571B|nr:D-glucuronyl C5-epimerase-like [Lepeophtheirus salmonis]
MFHRWRCYFFALAIISFISIISFYFRHFSSSSSNQHFGSIPSSSCRPPIPAKKNSLSPLSCRVNQKVLENIGKASKSIKEIEAVECYQNQEKEVFIPFSLMKNTQDDVKGELIEKKIDKEPYFAIEFSYSRVFRDSIYKGPQGQFLYFGNFDVESRSRVLCISAGESVPVSSQWGIDGYLYPTQIAQYGLSHWSKALRSNISSNRTIFESGLPGATADWDGDTTRVKNLKCIHFDTSSSISLKLSSSKKILYFDLFPSDNVTFIVSILMGNHKIYLRYMLGNSPPFIRRKGNTITFTYSDEMSKIRFIRNLHNDIVKGGLTTQMSIKTGKVKPIVDTIKFSGVGCVTNLTLSNQEHYLMFMSAVDWFVNNQDRNGGWAANILFNEKKLKYSKADEIMPGWYSGMAQGHGLSLLSRAFIYTKDRKYLEAAKKALSLFSLPSSKGGFRAVFLDTYVWYEEYPTKPSSFVLNGFMYSLFGLYDLSVIQKEYNQALSLYEEGIHTLMEMIHLFDVGYRTVYDLRHFTMKVPPKLARWDYHSTHINLLYALSSVQNDSKVQEKMIEIADRWVQYMLGFHSEHN